jgi:hypothetical protein
MTDRTPQTIPASVPARTCRWIDGDVREPGWRYCDQQALAGRSWCTEHSARVYRRVRVTDLEDEAGS